ncbi:MAG TPA: VOC family protein [Conexibacter sp.]|nr:VOC family protein [Conexibacter sp.]
MNDVPQITQIGLVVEDLQATMEAYHKALGWGPWYVYEHKPPALHHLRLHGEEVEFSMLGAEVQVGPIAFELLQPLEGPSAYREWLDEHGEGLHHVACMAHSKEELEALRARMDELGVETLSSGRLGEDHEFYYFDSQPLLKAILETGNGHAKELAKPIRVYPPTDEQGVDR